MPGSEAAAAEVSPPAAEAPGRLALIDGHSLLHRAYHALPPLSSPDGHPTGAVFGFLTMMFKLMEDEHPSHLAVAMDRPEPTFRHQAFEAYKAQRAAMPDDLASQVGLLRRVLAALEIPVVESPGHEADDVLASLARRAAADGFDVLVLTGDRDLLQVATDRVLILLNRFRGGVTNLDRMDRGAVRQRYGVDPERLVDMKSLCGDTSDNIPGVPGIAEKTALRLIQEHGSLDGLLADLDAGGVAPRRVATSLAENRERVVQNRSLVTIVRDLSLDVSWDDCRRRSPGDWGAARELLAGLGFNSLLRRLGGPDPAAEPLAEVPWRSLDPDRDPAALAGEPAVALVAEWLTDGRPAALALAAPGLAEAVAAAPAALAAAACEALQQHLGGGAGGDSAAEQGPERVGWDLKPWLRSLWRQGGRWRPVAFDAAVAAYLLDSGRSSYPLEDLARNFLGRRLASRAEVFGSGRDARPAEAIAPDHLAGWLAARAQACLDLREPMEADLASRGPELAALYRDVELPLIEVLAAMEAHGVCVDRAALDDLRLEFQASLEAAAQAVYDAAEGESFNINSTQQLAHILFETLGLKPPRRTKTGFSTDADVLETLSAEHALPARVLEYRTLQKLQSTYVEALGPLIDPGTGRIHTTFNQTVAATGRLSSENPNLQNIPVREEVGRRIRRVFVAPPGCVLVSADYSQIELRILAHLAGDQGLVAAFRSGADFHRTTAAEVFGVPPDEVSDQQRNAAKAVNFGIVYGISDFGLARQLHCDLAEAHTIIERYFGRYPALRAYLDGSVASARQDGFVRTLYGRVRHLPEIASQNRTRRALAERMAMNSPIQGTAADLIKRAMVRAHAGLAAEGLRAALVLQVHDELIFEAPDAEQEAVAGLARACMEGAGELAVPLRAEVKAGANWLDMEPVET